MLDTGLKMKTLDLFDLEKLAPGPEVDYSSMIRFLAQYYAAPERKLQELQRQKVLLRLKKGFYVFNSKKTSRVYRPEIVSNLLYGPSYLSLEFALAHYQLIPERVEEMTSVTTAKNKIYQTQIGTFSYQHLAHDLYPLLTRQESIEKKGYYLIASAEKAVLDFLVLKTKDVEFQSAIEVKQFLEDDLRLDWKELLSLVNRSAIESALPYYQRRRRARWFLELLLKEKI
jgi:hypothetical protein